MNLAPSVIVTSLFADRDLRTLVDLIRYARTAGSWVYLGVKPPVDADPAIISSSLAALRDKLAFRGEGVTFLLPAELSLPRGEEFIVRAPPMACRSVANMRAFILNLLYMRRGADWAFMLDDDAVPQGDPLREAWKVLTSEQTRGLHSSEPLKPLGMVTIPFVDEHNFRGYKDWDLDEYDVELAKTRDLPLHLWQAHVWKPGPPLEIDADANTHALWNIAALKASGAMDVWSSDFFDPTRRCYDSVGSRIVRKKGYKILMSRNGWFLHRHPKPDSTLASEWGVTVTEVKKNSTPVFDALGEWARRTQRSNLPALL